MIGNCEVCGIEFEKKSNSHRYCSECAKKAYKSNEKAKSKKPNMEWLKPFNEGIKTGKYHGVGGANAKSKDPWFKGV